MGRSSLFCSLTIQPGISVNKAQQCENLDSYYDILKCSTSSCVRRISHKQFHTIDGTQHGNTSVHLLKNIEIIWTHCENIFRSEVRSSSARLPTYIFFQTQVPFFMCHCNLQQLLAVKNMVLTNEKIICTWSDFFLYPMIWDKHSQLNDVFFPYANGLRPPSHHSLLRLKWNYMPCV